MLLNSIAQVPTEVIVAIIAGAFGSTGLWQLVQFILNRRDSNKKDPNKELLLGIVYFTLMQQCEYYLTRGYIEPEEFVDLNKYLFEPYEARGGNGTAKKMVARLEKLPSCKPEQ